MDEKLKTILSKQFSIPANDIAGNTDVIEDLGADSIDIVEIMMHIEKAYKIKVEEKEYQGRTTIDSLMELIVSKLSEHQQ